MQALITSEAHCTIPGNKPQVVIRNTAINHLYKFRQTSQWKKEAGGQLFAKVHNDEWIIEKATGPRRSDFRSRFSFRPNRATEQNEINKLFTNNLHYVGDWHTHPQLTPTPSDTDIRSMSAMVQASNHELPGFLMIIMGTELSDLWVSLHNRDGSWNRYNVDIISVGRN